MSIEGRTGLLVRHDISRPGCASRMEHVVVDAGEVELMDAVIVQEVFERGENVLFIVEVALGIAEGTADQHGGTVTDVSGDEGVGQLRLAEVEERGIDGVAEVPAGVDQRAVEIEDKQTGSGSGPLQFSRSCHHEL